MNSKTISSSEIIINVIKHLTLTSNQLLLLVSAYITLILNLPFLTKSMSAITSLEDYNLLFLLTFPAFLFGLTVILQSLFSFKWLLKPTLIITVLLSALMFYATLTYGVVFDYGMVQNAVETDSAELFSYFNLYAVIFFTVFGVIPAMFIYLVNVTYSPLFKQIINRVKLIVVTLILTVCIGGVFYSNYAAVGRNNKDLISYITPYKFVDSAYKYVRNHYFYPPLKFKLLDTAPQIVKANNNKKVTVFVLGETARAQSFSLNGYQKQTNRYTPKQGVISFNNMASCGTATAISVPCMFSRLDKKEYNKRIATAQQNVIDIVHLAGADVLWVSNNNGSCKGVCTRVKTEKIATDKGNPLCDGEYCFDEVLLQPLRKKLTNLSSDNTLIVLHMIGSHGPTYFKRYPSDKRIFTPDCQRSDIQNCTEQELINSYDNTIAYTDYVLAQVISELAELSNKQNVTTSMLYVSDHGESLGESGVYLHGLPYAFAPQEQTHVPMIFWTNTEQNELNLHCLESVSSNVMSHDNVFDVLLNITSVQTKSYHRTNDPFYNCKSAVSARRSSLNNNQEVTN